MERPFAPIAPWVDGPNAMPTMQPPPAAASRWRLQWRRLPWHRITAYYLLSYPFVVLVVFLGWQRHQGIGMSTAEVAINVIGFPIMISFFLVMVYVMVAFLVDVNRNLTAAFRPVPSPAQIAYQLELE